MIYFRCRRTLLIGLAVKYKSVRACTVAASLTNITGISEFRWSKRSFGKRFSSYLHPAHLNPYRAFVIDARGKTTNSCSQVDIMV